MSWLPGVNASWVSQSAPEVHLATESWIRQFVKLGVRKWHTDNDLANFDLSFEISHAPVEDVERICPSATCSRQVMIRQRILMLAVQTSVRAVRIRRAAFWETHSAQKLQSKRVWPTSLGERSANNKSDWQSHVSGLSPRPVLVDLSTRWLQSSDGIWFLCVGYGQLQ